MRTKTMQWVEFITIVIVAAGINVYISVITLSVFIASAFNYVYYSTGRVRVIHSAGAACLVAVNFVAFNLFGYVTAADWPVLPTNDFGRYSANLLTFISPPAEVSLLLRSPWIDPAQQGEGFGYLGLGTCLLVTIAMIRDPLGVGTIVRRLAPLLAAGICLFIWALLDRIRIGGGTLFTIPFSPLMVRIIGSLHANGRFIWLLMYLIPIIAVAALARHAKPRTLLLILTAAAMLQAAEVVPLINGLRSVHETDNLEYQAASRLSFSPAVRNFLVLPPLQCGGTPGPVVAGHIVAPVTFQSFVSLLNGLRSNSQYMARTPAKTQEAWCKPDIMGDIAALRPDSVYYFSTALYKQLTPSNRSGHWCDVLFDGVLCRPDVSTLGESDAARAAREHP